jgi:hypothetical protein
MVKRTIVNICGNDYDVEFPNVGQLQDIEAFKLAITGGRYVEMAIGGLRTQAFALDLADALAYFSVLVPELKHDLKVKNWREVDPFVAKQIVKDFKQNFLKWYKPIVDDLYNFDTDEIDEGDGQEQEK